MPRGQAKRSPYIRAAEWEPHRQEICELYETKPLEKVQAVMKRKHGLDATISQYKRQLGIWKVVKNGRASHRKAHEHDPGIVINNLPAVLSCRDTYRRVAMLSAGAMMFTQGKYDILAMFKDSRGTPFKAMISPHSIQLGFLSSGALLVFFTLLARFEQPPEGLPELLSFESMEAIDSTRWFKLVLVIMGAETQAMTRCEPHFARIDRGLTQIVTNLIDELCTAESIKQEADTVLKPYASFTEEVTQFQRVWQTQRNKLDMPWCEQYIQNCDRMLDVYVHSVTIRRWD